MVKSQVLDDLHTVYIGVTKKIILMLLGNKAFGRGEQFDLIDEELQRNKGIAEISSMKGFSSISDWKGKHFYMFLLFYGLPFMKEYLIDDNFTAIWLCLNNAIYTCSLERISDYDLSFAENEMKKFKSLYKESFGIENMSPNFHELTEHLCFAVKNTGPLWINSTFNFEEINFLNRNCVRSSLRPDIQIYKRY